MRISIGCVVAKVLSADTKELEWIERELSFTVKNGNNSRIESLLWTNKTFPSGLIPFLEKQAGLDRVHIEWMDTRPARSLIYDPAKAHWLRDYQKEAVVTCLQHLRGIVDHVTGCLTGDTVIEYNRFGESLKLPLGKFVEKFQAAIPGGDGNKLWNSDVVTKVRRMTSDGYIRLGTLKDAVYSGVKPVYKVTLADGKSIKGTADHRLLSTFGWKQIGQLNIGDCLYAETPKQKSKPIKHHYSVVGYLKRHPYAGRRNIKYGGYSVPTHRIVAEATLNGYEFREYVKLLKEGNIEDVVFLDPAVYAVHHKDHNHENNDPSNLEILTHKGHAKKHGDLNWKNVTANCSLVPITSIEYIGEEKTYDLLLGDDPHNFIANGIVVHNSGKGDTIASLCWTLTGKTLVCVPSKALVQQQAKRIRDRTSLKVDIFGDGFHDTKARIIVATYSALHVDSKRAIPKFPWAQIENVLFDEVHSIAAHTTWGVAAKLTHASVRLGFSATPHQRLDRKSVYVYGATGKIIHRLKPLEAHQLGAIALPDIKMYLFRHGVYSSRLDPRKASITYCHSRNELIKKVALLAPTPSIIFVAHTEHAEELLNYIPDSKVVHGKLSTKEQEQLKNDLGSSKLKRLISTPVFKQGVDIPELMSVVLASPTNSVIDTLQRIGRGTRRWAKDGSELKAIFPVYDIYDAGLPNLETQSMSRLSAYKKAGYPVSVV